MWYGGNQKHLYTLNVEHHSTSTITNMTMMPNFELISEKINFFYLGYSVVLSFTHIQVHKDKFPQHSTLFTLHIQIMSGIVPI